MVKYPVSYSVKENVSEGTITISAVYSDKIQPPAGFDVGEWTIEIVPSINQIIPVPVLCGDYYLVDINALKRGSISVNGKLQALSSDDKRDAAKNIANQLLLQYIPNNTKRVLKDSKVSFVQDGQMVHYSFNREETFMGDKFTI